VGLDRGESIKSPRGAAKKSPSKGVKIGQVSENWIEQKFLQEGHRGKMFVGSPKSKTLKHQKVRFPMTGANQLPPTTIGALRKNSGLWMIVLRWTRKKHP